MEVVAVEVEDVVDVEGQDVVAAEEDRIKDDLLHRIGVARKDPIKDRTLAAEISAADRAANIATCVATTAIGPLTARTGHRHAKPTGHPKPTLRTPHPKQIG